MGKRIEYHSGFSRPEVYWRPTTGAFSAVTMRDAGPGRYPGERRWEVILPADSGMNVQFYFSDAQGRDPRRRYYETALDYIFVQDGQLFDYQPASRVSPPSRAYSEHDVPSLRSRHLGESRRFRVYLPRGYRQHTHKRYPVLYMHDGQNIFDQGSFGSWNAQRTLDRVIARGQVKELIVVAVDSGPNRFNDYVPPEDGGRADAYARFLVDELKPYIDARFRTMPQPEHTGILGSSLGGVVSLYLGWDFFHVFRQVGAMSGSWWLRRFRTRILNERKRPIRFYLDTGDSGIYNDGVHHAEEFRNALLEKHEFELGDDFAYLLAHRHEHNEKAWETRLPQALRFLFPAA
ncbi:MAG: alpha/beta hydrolase [Vulcanimicrobiota bacterium]